MRKTLAYKPGRRVRQLTVPTLLLAMSLPLASMAEELRVAVASNFAPTFRRLAVQYAEQSDVTVTTIPGSTGKLFAQVQNGAPFDILFAADSERPAALEAEGYGAIGTRATYAIGSLVLWSAEPNRQDMEASLHANPRPRIAIANPLLAPYGNAAVELLKALELWEQLGPHLVRGENIAQTFQFVHSGNAAMGFVSRAQVLALPAADEGSSWLVPDSLYTPIDQQVVLLKDTKAGRDFLLFVRSPKALQIIQADGYDTP